MVPSKHVMHLPAAEVINKYDLITVYITEPTPKPDKAAEIQARPFDFGDDGEPTQYQTMCPFCTQGFIITPYDITKQFGLNFVACTSCERGFKPLPIPEPEPEQFGDPFVNPFSNGLTLADMDEALTEIEVNPEPITGEETTEIEQLSVADKLGDTIDELCAE